MRSISRIVSYVPDARRFDMGERDHFISMEMASIGMEMMAEWGADGRRAASLMLTERIADGVRGSASACRSAACARRTSCASAFSDGIPAALFVEGLASEDIYVAARLGRMRISPHVYNDEADADRFVAALTGRLRS